MEFVEQFGLSRHIHFNCSVAQVTKTNSIWNIHTEDNKEFRSKNVIICSGVHQDPNRDLEKTLFKGFQGQMIHSGSIKSFQHQHLGKRIMVVGGGETASDIITEYYPHVKSIIWCVPHGQHFFRKYSKLLPHRKPQALDKASSRMLTLIALQVKSKPGELKSLL